MDICETEGVIMKIKDYYKLSSTAAVVLQKYSETCDSSSIAPRVEFKNEVLTQEIAPHSREFASFSWDTWSNALLFPGYGGAGLSTD